MYLELEQTGCLFANWGNTHWGTTSTYLLEEKVRSNPPLKFPSYPPLNSYTQGNLFIVSPSMHTLKNYFRKASSPKGNNVVHYSVSRL